LLILFFNIGGASNSVENDSVVEPIPKELYREQTLGIEQYIGGSADGYGSSIELVEGQVAPIIPDLKIQTPVSCHAFTQKYYQTHRAVDLVSDCSLSVFSAKTGVVTFAQYTSPIGYGNKIEVNHGGGLYSLYGHLAAFEVSVGDFVMEGQKIGTMGSTGDSTGTHLHFELISSSVRINPELYFR